MSLINKIKGNKSLVNGSLFSFFSFFNQGIGFVLLILLAGYIAPEEYGHLSLFNTIITFLGFLICLSSQGFLGISYFQRKGELFKQDFSSIVLITVCCTVFFSFVLIVGHGYISKWTMLSPIFLWYTLLISFFTIFFHMILDYLRIQEKVKKYGLISCSFAVFNFVFSLYLVINKGLGWHGRVYAHIICAVVFGIFGLILFAKDRLFSTKITWDGTKAVILWGLPLIPHAATGWLKQGCDRFIINGAHTTADVGIFSFALNLANVIIIIGMAFNSTNSVSIYHILSTEKTAESKRKQLQKQTKMIFYIYLIASVLVVFFGGTLVPIILPKYTASVPLFLILSGYAFLKCLYFLWCNYLFYYRQNKQIMYITFASAVFHLGLSLLLTRYSLYFTCCIYVLTQAFILFYIMIKSRKCLAVNLID
jgi:O-antigen/teichoic acid export membrane protein